jgi:MFS family permease
MVTLASLVVPAGADAAALRFLVARALRAFADGYVAVLLPAYLLALGFGQIDVGLLSTATLAGSALATLAVGVIGHRWPAQRLLQAAAVLMAATGLCFAGWWPSAARSIRVRATSACSCHSNMRGWRKPRLAMRAPRCSRATR